MPGGRPVSIVMDRWDYLLMLTVIAVIAHVLHRQPRTVMPERGVLGASSSGMDGIWRDAVKNKGDVRPAPEPGMKWGNQDDQEAVRPAARPAPTPDPAPPAQPAAAPEPAPFPKPLPVSEPPAARPRLAPMQDSFRTTGGSEAHSAAFLAVPPPPAAQKSAAAEVSPAAAPSKPAPRPWRRLSTSN